MKETTNKQIAFAKVKLPNGDILQREVVEFNSQNEPIAHFPLKEEIAFTEWHNKTYVWPDKQEVK